MSTRFFYSNFIDASGVAITESSEASTLPSSNVVDDQMTKVWRTGTSTASEYVTFDLGSSQSATAAIIHNHTLTSGDSTITLRGSTDNFSASNVLIATFTHSTGTMLATFGAANYRYFRISFTKASSGVTRDIGRIFVGNYATLTALPDYDGWEEEKDTRETTLITSGGQSFSEIKSNGRKCRVRFSQIDQTDKDTIEAVRDAMGVAYPFFFQVDQTGPSGMQTPWYVKFSAKPKFKVTGYDASLRWDTELELSEQL